MKLLVRNLATTTTEEKLISLFSEYGKVQSCSLVLDNKTGKSKGFGFIEMPNPGEAKAAMKSLNTFKLAGNNIRVKKAESKTESKIESNVDESEVLRKSAPSVQFKQASKKSPATKKATLEGPIVKEDNNTVKIDNNDNAANIYGKIKESDDY